MSFSSLGDHLVAVVMFSAKQDLPSTQEWSTWQVLGPANLNWETNQRAEFQLQWGVRREFLPGFPKPSGYEESHRIIVTAMALLHTSLLNHDGPVERTGGDARDHVNQALLPSS